MKLTLSDTEDRGDEVEGEEDEAGEPRVARKVSHHNLYLSEKRLTYRRHIVLKLPLRNHPTRSRLRNSTWNSRSTRCLRRPRRISTRAELWVYCSIIWVWTEKVDWYSMLEMLRSVMRMKRWILPMRIWSILPLSGVSCTENGEGRWD
jgi:hypothetical protein